MSIAERSTGVCYDGMVCTGSLLCYVESGASTLMTVKMPAGEAVEFEEQRRSPDSRPRRRRDRRRARVLVWVGGFQPSPVSPSTPTGSHP